MLLLQLTLPAHQRVDMQSLAGLILLVDTLISILNN